jgi:hypothetical protein
MKDKLKELIKTKLKENTKIETVEDPDKEDEEDKESDRKRHPNKMSTKEKKNMVYFVKEHIKNNYL